MKSDPEARDRGWTGEIFLIGVREDLSDYILSDTPPMDDRKWGISFIGPSERILLSLGLPEMARLSVLDRKKLREIYKGYLNSLLREISSLKTVPYFIMVADDCASYGGPLMPKWYMELYLEGHRMLADEIRSSGAKAFLHADGNYRDYFRELGMIWDLIHPLDVYPRGDMGDFIMWIRVVRKLRSQIEGEVATGIPLELGDERLIIKAVEKFLREGIRDLVLSNFHPPLTDLDVGWIVGRIKDDMSRGG